MKRIEPVNKTGFRIIYIILGIIFAVLLLLGYWAFVPIDVLEIKKLPVPVTNPENIKSGRIIFLEFEYCKYINIKGQVKRHLISERAVIELPSYEDSTPKSCNKIKAPTVLPYTVAAQKFHIHYTVTYPANPIRNITEEFDTQEFTILPIEGVPAK